MNRVENGDMYDADVNGGTDTSQNYHNISGNNELFAEENRETPWWNRNFFISQPVLFGTWDGVFTSCLINIIGVIVFLRFGWIVAEAGIFTAIVIILCTVLLVFISVLSAIGICERCRVESGGVYFILSHVLGCRYAGAVGVLYCFGQSVGCALNVVGFGESIVGLLNFNFKWLDKLLGCLVVVLLSVINLAGVKWVIKLQFLLLVVLLSAAMDLIIGSFEQHDDARITGWSTTNFRENVWSNYTTGNDWFTIFGVFFPTVTGILAGINMSGDLRAPSSNIPNGTLAAIGTGCLMYLAFIVLLGSTCKRVILETDFMVAVKVSGARILLLAGLYVSSMSSCLGAMYGTPRVLQSIAKEKVIAGLHSLGMGRGPNKVPVNAVVMVAAVILTFIVIGDINSLAPVVTMPFLFTWASIDYAYFALAQTSELHTQRERRFNARLTDDTDEDTERVDDLDVLFPDRMQHKHNYNKIVDLRGEERAVIHQKTHSWYAPFCNRWLSLFGACLKLLIMLFVHWKYACASFTFVFLLWVYIGTTNPAVKPGIAADFKFFAWFKSNVMSIWNKNKEYEQIVIPSGQPYAFTQHAQVNDVNVDFASRRRYHQSETMVGEIVRIEN